MKPTELRIATFVLLAVFSASQVFLAHNVLYTEGEIMQGLYWLLVAVNVPLFAIAFWKPKWSLWGGLVLGALLLPLQAAENRKWAQIHEEVTSIIRFLEAEQENSGDYPDTLSGYAFQRDWVADHVTYEVSEDVYQRSYFMDHPSIGYWYYPEDGFGYYPD